jgi:uncharacterized membrane protein
MELVAAVTVNIFVLFLHLVPVVLLHFGSEVYHSDYSCKCQKESKIEQTSHTFNRFFRCGYEHLIYFVSSVIVLVVLSLYRHMRSSSPADIVGWILQTVFEVITTAISGTTTDESEIDMDDEFGELLFYKEYEDRNLLPPRYFVSSPS